MFPELENLPYYSYKSVDSSYTPAPTPDAVPDDAEFPPSFYSYTIDQTTHEANLEHYDGPLSASDGLFADENAVANHNVVKEEAHEMHVEQVIESRTCVGSEIGIEESEQTACQHVHRLCAVVLA
jgi:hypothetical protein